MRVASSSGTPGSHNSSRGFYHPYSPASGAWLFSDSSEESSGCSVGDSLLCDDGIHPISASFKPGGQRPPQRLILYPSPIGSLAPSVNERGCPTVAQYLAVETSYVNDHAPARRQKALLSYQSMCEIAQVLAAYNEPLVQLEDGRYSSTTVPTDGIMASAAMRHWARSKFTLSHDGVVLCKGKQVLVREQFYSALCWAHLQSAHGGRDKTSRVLWRFGGVPKELIMRFVASCPTCIDKAAAIRRTMKNPTMNPEEESATAAEEPDQPLDADMSMGEPCLQPDSLSLPPIRQLLSNLFRSSDESHTSPRGLGVLDSPTNFSPVGSAFDEIPSPPQGYIAQHEAYNGVSLSSPGEDTALSETLPAVQHVFSQFDSPAEPTYIVGEVNAWGHSLPAANDSEETADDSCISDDSAYPSMLEYKSSLYTQAPARDALMFTWSTAPMQRQAATEGVGLSPPSSPLMRGYARLASPAVEESPMATARLLGESPMTGGGISGWSPSSASSTSPGAARMDLVPSPAFNNTAFRLYDTPLSRFSNRTFYMRWEAMYEAGRDADDSQLQGSSPTHSLEGTEGHAIIVEDDASVSDPTAMVNVNAVALDAARIENESPAEAPADEMQYEALGFTHKPIGRARAHSHSLGLALQTDFSADGAPTPPLTATSTLSARSPISPGLQTPAHSLLMQIASTSKADGYAAGGPGGELEAVHENMLPWNEGLPTEHDPLAPHNMLHDWINMDYVDEQPMKPEGAGKQGDHQVNNHLSGVEVA